MSGLWDLDKQQMQQKVESSGNILWQPHRQLLADGRENKRKEKKKK